jgi:acyl-CoA synthetase (NDP forming)
VSGLGDLFDPKSVVIVGASADTRKWGHQYARTLLAAADRRAVWLVNASGKPVLGQGTFRSCAELPSAPAVAVICVPAAVAEAAVEDAAGAGAQFIVCVTAGFAEKDAEGAGMQARVVAAARRHGARLVGPNCLGVFNAAARFECTGFWPVVGGPVGLVSQSGTVMLELGERLRDVGLGLSRAVSVGNQADVSIPELLATYSEDPATKACVAYVEQFKEGRALFIALEGLLESGTPCVVLAPGSGDAVRRAVASHTGSMVSGDDIINSACEDIGVPHVRSIAAAIRALRGLLAAKRSAGRRVAVIADGGGSAVLGTDACASSGLAVPAFSRELQLALRDALAAGSGIRNPVDTVGALSLEDMRPAIELVLRSDEVDAVLLAGALNNVGDLPAADNLQSARSIAVSAAREGKAVAVASMLPSEPAMVELVGHGVPVTVDAVEAAEIIRLGMAMPARRRIPSETREGECAAVTASGYFAARKLFASAGIPLMPAGEVTNVAQALETAQRCGYPVVLKALGTSHKSDTGGVVMNITHAAELERHFEDLAGRLRAQSFSVESMADGSASVELIVGSIRDPNVGPTIAVGAGGTLAELFGDIAVALAPVSPHYAAGMIERLKIAPLLRGFRGRPPVDVGSLADLVARFSRILFLHPDLAEAEMNPVLARASGCVALDARIAIGRPR